MKYANIIYNDIVNTNGMALSFYTQGCTHHCKGCFSKKTWNFNGGLVFTKEIENEIRNILNLYSCWYDNLCLLGGDPFDSIIASLYIISIFKEFCTNKNVWCYTGYTFEELLKDKDKLELLKYIDVLVDGKFIEELKDLNLKFKGSSNQRLIRVQESLKQNKIILYEI